MDKLPITPAEKMMQRVNIILVSPKYPENIGSAVRAAHNMGISKLSVVGSDNYEVEKIHKTATHNAVELVENIGYFENLQEALSSCTVVIGTTARCGRHRTPQVLPSQIAESTELHLLDGEVGLMFGPENQGLTNSELKNCGLVTTIPTARFSSVNLGQAVAIMSYELYQGVLKLGRSTKHLRRPKPANLRELESMYASIDAVCLGLDTLLKIKKSDIRQHSLRMLLGRLGMAGREAKVVKDTFNDMLKILRQNNNILQ